MRTTLAAFLLALTVGCTAGDSAPVGVDPGEAGDGGGDSGGGTAAGSGGGTMTIPDVHCAGTPDAGPPGDWVHGFKSPVISALGSPKHRGEDLVASASAATQTIEGDISYTIADKALEDENVDVFACRQNAWEKLGTARTDGEGHFALALTGGDRLPIGLRDMYVSVVGDRTGASFVAFVAPDGTKLFVSDVDGTLTASENAFTEAIVTGADVGFQPGAPEAFAAAVAKGYQPVYVTARGREFTGATRSWLADKGFPRGPLRLSPSFVTLPGGDTVDYKTGAFQDLEAAGMDVAVGVGNRDSDITAYTNANVPADHIFIKLPEYQSECQADLDAHEAIGIASYNDLATQYIPGL